MLHSDVAKSVEIAGHVAEMRAIAIHIHATASELHISDKNLVVDAGFRHQLVGMLKENALRVGMVS